MSQQLWRIDFGDGTSVPLRLVNIGGGDVAGLRAHVQNTGIASLVTSTLAVANQVMDRTMTSRECH
jgi:hypothetical protein